jgi:hypothetical protein
MAQREPNGIQFWLEAGRENEARLVDDRMSISGDSFYWYQVDENLSRWKYLVIHHSVTPNNSTAEDLAQIHLRQGWSGIGYHFVITRDGVIHYVGDLGTWRANVGGMNDVCIGVNLIGDFRFGNTPSDAQYRAANVLYREFVADTRFPGIKGSASLKFHRELNATACPGDVDKNKILTYAPQATTVIVTPKPVVQPPLVVNSNPPTTPIKVILPPAENKPTIPSEEQQTQKPVVVAPGPAWYVVLFEKIMDLIKVIKERYSK